MRLVVLSAAFATLMVSACDAASPPAVTLLGAGGKSCGSWTQDRRSNADIAFGDEQWLLGYVSAANAWYLSGTLGDVLKNTDSAGLAVWVDNYCANHPLDMVDDAAVELVTYLMKKRAFEIAATPRK